MGYLSASRYDVILLAVAIAQLIVGLIQLFRH